MRRRREEVERDENGVRPGWASPCHPDGELAIAILYRVKATGEEIRIGRIVYCPFVDWTTGKRVECFKIHKLFYSRRNWPKGLMQESIPAILGRHAPGYWFNSGYHIAKKGSDWLSMRDKRLEYLPPFKSEDDLLPAARHVLNYRRKHPLGSVPMEKKEKPVEPEERFPFE